jgi:thymidylate synthase
MYIKLDTPSEVVEVAIGTCINYGSPTTPRGQSTLEVNNVTFEIQRPWLMPFDVKYRDMKPFIGAVEALQLVGMTTAPELVVSGSKVFGNYLDGGIFHGAYGPRIYGRLKPLVDLLKSDPDSRQAVLTIFDSRQDLGANVKDVPCTLALQFFVRDNKLCMRTTMRSNDVWLGLPYDLVQFTALQGAIAAALGIEMGWYAHSVGSLHLYARDMEQAEQIQANYDQNWDYEPLWSRDTIELISGTARGILYGWQANMYLAGLTKFETWLENAVFQARERII